MTTTNDEIGLATLQALYGPDERASHAAWCRISRRGMVRVRFLRHFPGKFDWKPGDEWWFWADQLTDEGELTTKAFGHYPPGSVEAVDRINERGE